VYNCIATHERIVLAADDVGAAAATTNTDDGDGAAGETDQDIKALDNNAEETKQQASRRRGSLADGLGYRQVAITNSAYALHAVAALNGTGAALASGLSRGRLSRLE
jgi:hypothetical protein